MSEGELKRLRQALERLMDGQQEALDAIEETLKKSEGFEQEATLVDLQDILEGAYEDAQNILGGSEGSEL